MLNKSKIEKIVLCTIMVMYFLLLKNYFSSLIYIIAILLASVYFFPIKVILNWSKEKSYLLIGSSFLISVVLVFSYLSYVIEELSQSFKIILLFLSLANIFCLYKLVQRNETEKFLHLILLFLLIAAFLK
jgi:hypothetical protein